MRFDLNIDYPVEKMARSRQRLAARDQFAYVDRVPVGFCLVPRYFTPIFGIPYSTIFKNVREHYTWQLQFLKYRIENIPEDIVCTSTTLNVAPYFDNVLDSAAFGAEIVWPDNETLHSRPVISSVEQMERYPMPAPMTGLWKQAVKWSRDMREFAKETRLTFNGVEGRIDVASPGISGLSPHMIAIDLVGVEFYCWQAEYPDACHRFLNRITEALIAAQRAFLALDNRSWNGVGGLAEDTATAMSPAMYREFCVPYADRLFAAAPTRGIHMCGPSTHLHQALIEDMRMTHFDLFGYVVDPAVAARNLGGKARLWGNINPMLMRTGTKAEVKQAALEALEAMAPCGGLLLGDGANVCPGTPIENLAALTEAAEAYGLPERP
jgi:uroporphyrinogen-III decarboxylase